MKSLGPESRSVGRLLGILLCFAHADIASAHAHLISAEPGEGVTISTAPKELRLTFSEGLSKPSGVTIAATNKGDMPIGASAITGDSDKVMVVSFPQPLGTGQYTVNWHALARDGHTTRGSYTFTVQP